MTPERVKRYHARVRKQTIFLRDWLLMVLGGRCEKCGDDGTWAPLSIEHKAGRREEARRLWWWKRIRWYWAQHRAGVPLAVRCIPCNSADGSFWAQKYRSTRLSEEPDDEKVPF